MEEEYEGPYLVTHGNFGLIGKNRFGALLRSLRDLNGLSRAQLADKVNISSEFVRNIEIGIRAPSRTTAGQMLGCMKKNHGINWFMNKEFDLLIKDPEKDCWVAFIFKQDARGRRKQRRLETKSERPTMVIMQETYTGLFDVEFVGESGKPRRIEISHPVQSYNGHILYLVGTDNTCWNWSNIIRTKRVT